MVSRSLNDSPATLKQTKKLLRKMTDRLGYCKTARAGVNIQAREINFYDL